MTDIVVVDYGMGNLRSVSKALEHVAPKASVVISSRPEDMAAAGRIVFPGVGAMGDCVAELESRGLVEAVKEAAAQKPFLGICLGMQALFESSEEGGESRGLGILPGKVVRFPAEKMGSLKVPHIGWNEVRPQGEHALWQGIPEGSRFYFVHSYYVPADNPAAEALTEYPFPFASACARENMFAVQFHPEKSQAAGLRLLANFVEWRV